MRCVVLVLDFAGEDAGTVVEDWWVGPPNRPDVCTGAGSPEVWSGRIGTLMLSTRTNEYVLVILIELNVFEGEQLIF